MEKRRSHLETLVWQGRVNGSGGIAAGARSSGTHNNQGRGMKKKEKI